MKKEELLSVIKARLKERGMSAADASQRAVGNPYLVTNMGRERYGLPTMENLLALCDVLDLELRVGPPLETGTILTTEVGGDDFTVVPRYTARLSAGPGTDNTDTAPAGAIAFRRDWLTRERISPAQAMVLNVRGDSMAPTLCDGDLVMIDSRRKAVIGRRIYALIGPDGEARVKRLERLPNALLLHSDNPDFATEMIPPADADRIQILGEVVWWGHTAKE